MTEMEKANIRLLIVNFSMLWKDREIDGSFDKTEVEKNIIECSRIVHTDPKMLGWNYG